MATRAGGNATVFLLIAALTLGAARGSAQYPVVASPVLSLDGLTATPKIAGYVSMRADLRGDSATMRIGHARLGAIALPLPYIAVKIQGELAAIGRATGDTVPPIILTDAFVQLTLPNGWGDSSRAIRPWALVGQFRTPFAIEYLTPATIAPTIEHSQAGELISTRRDIGFMASVDVAGRAVVSGAVVNGEGANHPANPDGTQMLIGRATLVPLRTLGVSAIWLGERGDHRWGTDVRWTPGRGLLEAQLLRRSGPLATTGTTATIDASGGYAQAAYHIRPWLQPAVKWEQLRRQSTTGAGVADDRLTWTTYAINLIAPADRMRLQLNWIAKSERPVARDDQFIAQLQAIF
ncbi:MAG: hypothetical protein NVS9B3_12260 [Gemmatimonadaceae bacterium]